MLAAQQLIQAEEVHHGVIALIGGFELAHGLDLGLEPAVDAGHDSQVHVGGLVAHGHLRFVAEEHLHALVLVRQVRTLGALGPLADVDVLGAVQGDAGLVVHDRGLRGEDGGAPAAALQLGHGLTVVVLTAHQQDAVAPVDHAGGVEGV